MTKYTYLLIDCMSIAVPLIFSFHPRIRLYRHWNALIPAILITAFVYCLWDSWFTRFTIWGFSTKYTMGIYLGNLPLEELLFFICIPYACVFTYECLSGINSGLFALNNSRVFNYTIAAIFSIVAIVFCSRPYTATAFFPPAIMIICITAINILWLPKFYITYVILLVPFLVVNGLLTGTGLSEPVVWYNPQGITGLRIMTIPIEDIFYGMGLILANVWLYTALKKDTGYTPTHIKSN